MPPTLEHKLHTGVKIFNLCDYKTTAKRYLTVHMARRHLEKTENPKAKPFKCTKCELMFRTKAQLTVHEKTHTAEKLWVCDECDYASRTEGQLKVHKDSHNGEIPYSCLQCDYTADTRQTLRTHTRKHSEEKHAKKRYFQCEYCEYMARQKKTLTNHVKKIHEAPQERNFEDDCSEDKE